MDSLALGDLHRLVLINTAAAAQLLYQKRQGRSPASTSLLLSSSSSSRSTGSSSTQLSSSSVPEHHTRLIELLGLTGLDLVKHCFNTSRISEDLLLRHCWMPVCAAGTAYEEAAALFSSNRSVSSNSRDVSDGGSGTGGSGDSVSSILQLTQQLLPQLQLVLVEMVALLPVPRLLAVCLELLNSIIEHQVQLYRHLCEHSQDQAAPSAVTAAMARLFQPLVQLVAPAVLHAAGSGVEEPWIDMDRARVRYALVIFAALGGLSEWDR